MRADIFHRRHNNDPAKRNSDGNVDCYVFDVPARATLADILEKAHGGGIGIGTSQSGIFQVQTDRGIYSRTDGMRLDVSNTAPSCKGSLQDLGAARSRGGATVSQAYQPKTGAACGCRRGQERDNCANCEGTGMVIDFKAIRSRSLTQPVQSDRKGENIMYKIGFNRTFALTQVNLANPVALPFAEIGATGSYGVKRSQLVRAVQAGQWERAELLFNLLVNEIVIETNAGGYMADSLQHFLDYCRATAPGYVVTECGNCGEIRAALGAPEGYCPDCKEASTSFFEDDQSVCPPIVYTYAVIKLSARRWQVVASAVSSRGVRMFELVGEPSNDSNLIVGKAALLTRQQEIAIGGSDAPKDSAA